MRLDFKTACYVLIAVVLCMRIGRSRGNRQIPPDSSLGRCTGEEVLNSNLASHNGHGRCEMSGGRQLSPAFVIWGYFKKIQKKAAGERLFLLVPLKVISMAAWPIACDNYFSALHSLPVKSSGAVLG